MRTVSRFRAGLALLFALGFSACAADGSFRFAVPPPVPYPPPGYAHTVSTAAVVLYWNCAHPETGALRLEGLAFNPWGDQPIQYLEFELAGIDADGHTVSEASAEARDAQIFTNQSSPFAVDLQTTGREVRYDLYYQYQYQEQGHDTFISGPMVPGAFPRHQGDRFLARDACSPTQHLAQ